MRIPQKKSASCEHFKPARVIAGKDSAPEIPASLNIPMRHSAGCACLIPRRLKLSGTYDSLEIIFFKSYKAITLLYFSGCINISQIF